ncbi:ribose-phosphate diphosphokinase [Crenothrix polyspora]|uniref:Ribose-phosphate pyrophosphokinase n=1 Tax=Crenothrix polyspora TaxID=360316 RepID=A0A1R4H856_9GAMM|nr:ribose-phosphate diphosphokinase [Crenothrix polyspora]SJM92458.1 Ribose-phosphate pyrophosphokinase [Crenothrix polyspora]
MMILAFPDYLSQSQRIATRLNVELAEISVHHFPDGESLVRLPPSLPEHVILCRSLTQPNDKLIELLLCATTARELGAKRLTLVAPYLCYMRQDIANQPGEAVSQRIIGKLLAGLFDDIITVDPHLHRISSLDQAIPTKHVISLTAAGEIGRFLKQKLNHALLLGPDSESEQWVAKIASQIGFDYGIAHKERLGDKQVEITLPERNYRNHAVVIIDDMASTGRTLGNAAKLLQAAGCEEIYAVVTHALFCGDAETHILQAGVKAIWTSDSIEHSTARIRLDGLLANALAAIM